jgi:hypothetical protein
LASVARSCHRTLKFVVIGAVGVPACFAVGYGMTRVPGVSKVF